MQIRTVLVGWVLTLATLIACTLIWANWYEYRPAESFAGAEATRVAFRSGWEPVLFPGRDFWYWRRPRLSLSQ